MRLRLLFAAGGTGGHIFPAMAVADRVREIVPDAAIEFVGTRGRLEERVVPRAGYKLNYIWISGFERKLSLNALLFPLKVGTSLLQARGLIGRFKPDAVICAGAYVSYPMGVAASMKRIPLVLMASDARPGLAFSKIAARANQIHVAFDSAAEYFRSIGARCEIFLSGNPVREILSRPIDRGEARRHFGLDPDRPTLFAFGGSLGAQSINVALEQILEQLLSDGVQVIWQTGKSYSGTERKERGLYRTVFLNEMELGYAAADLILSRAGATTISELQVVGKPAIFVPLPIAAVRQIDNAMAMKQAGVAEVIIDDALNEDLYPVITELLGDPDRLRKMGERARALAVPDSADRIARSVMELVKKG